MDRLVYILGDFKPEQVYCFSPDAIVYSNYGSARNAIPLSTVYKAIVLDGDFAPDQHRRTWGVRKVYVLSAVKPQLSFAEFMVAMEKNKALLELVGALREEMPESAQAQLRNNMDSVTGWWRDAFLRLRRKSHYKQLRDAVLWGASPELLQQFLGYTGIGASSLVELPADNYNVTGYAVLPGAFPGIDSGGVYDSPHMFSRYLRTLFRDADNLQALKSGEASIWRVTAPWCFYTQNDIYEAERLVLHEQLPDVIVALLPQEWQDRQEERI